MKNGLLLLTVLSFLAAGCSSVKIVPGQGSNGLLNPADNSQTVNSKGIELSVKVDETGINAYNLETTVTAFKVSVKNNTEAEVAFTEESFVLIDDKGLQYSLLTPEKIRDMLKKDSYYLMPYPYVGFYYLEDYQKTGFYNRLNSSLPYYYELYPQDIFTKSFPLTAVIPGMKIEGLTYFKIDPANHQGIKLLVYRKGASKSSPPDFVLPFKIVK